MILSHKFTEFEEDIKPLAEPIAQATLNLFQQVQDTFKPTPAKSHYVFNMRDISKVVQGMYMLDKFYCDSKMTIFRLWVHECLRVFHDRLISFEDRTQIKQLISG
jgi:dynein heavy chain